MTSSVTFFNKWISNLQKADPDIWMRSSKDGTHNEYTAFYVEDLAICMKDPPAFCDTLKENNKLKLKGVGPHSYHLGCGYTRDEDGTLVQIQGNMLTRFLSPMKNVWGETKEGQNTTSSKRSHQKNYLSSVTKTK